MKKQSKDHLDHDLLRAQRKRLKEAYPQLFGEMSHIFFVHDPLHICDESNPNRLVEYEPEVGTILPRLREAHSAEETGRIVYEEIVTWFGRSAGGYDQRYREIGEEVWAASRRYPLDKADVAGQAGSLIGSVRLVRTSLSAAASRSSI